MIIDWSGNPAATHFDPVDQNFLREVGSALLLFNKNKGWTSPVHTSYGVTIEDCHRPLIKRPEWDGDGLPPVGAVCEYQDSLGQWEKVEITAIAKMGICFVQAAHDGENYVSKISARFRPIRTAEQIAAEERNVEINALSEELAGYEGINGVRARHHNMALYLVDQGYRKQEAAQ